MFDRAFGQFFARAARAKTLEIVSEHDEVYMSDEHLRWLQHLERDEWLRDEVWPHADEWSVVKDSFESAPDWFRKKLAEELEGERRLLAHEHNQDTEHP